MKLLLTFRDLKEYGLPYSRVHVSRLVRRGLFPSPIQLNRGGSVVWRAGDVEQWIDERAKQPLVDTRGNSGRYQKGGAARPQARQEPPQEPQAAALRPAPRRRLAEPSAPAQQPQEPAPAPRRRRPFVDGAV